MTWGRYRTGTRVWHLVRESDTQTTYCGRSFEQRPFALRIRVPEDDGDMCYHCSRIWCLEARPLALAAKAGMR